MRVFFLNKDLKLFPDCNLELSHFFDRAFPIVNDLLRLYYLDVTVILDFDLFTVINLEGQPALNLFEDFWSEASDIDIDDERRVHDRSTLAIADLADVLYLQPGVVRDHEIDLRLFLLRMKQ
jgi:hypothetical protein